MSNEKLILETLNGLMNDNNNLMEITSGLILLLTKRVSAFSDQEKDLLLSGSKMLAELVVARRAAAETLRNALGPHQ